MTFSRTTHGQCSKAAFGENGRNPRFAMEMTRAGVSCSEEGAYVQARAWVSDSDSSTNV